MEILEKIDELLLKVEIGQTSIIFVRNLAKHKKVNQKLKKNPKCLWKVECLFTDQEFELGMRVSLIKLFMCK